MKVFRSEVREKLASASHTHVLSTATAYVSLIGFISAIFFNELVFSNYGMSFLRIAGVGDVLISSAGYIILICFHVILATIICLIGASAASLHKKYFFRINDNLYALICAIAIFAAITKATYYAFILLGIDISYMKMKSFYIAIAALAISTPTFIHIENTQRWEIQLYDWFYRNRVFFWIISSIFLFAYMISFSLELKAIQAKANSALYVMFDQYNCKNPRVVWLGQESIVSNCDLLANGKNSINHSYDRYIILPRSDYTIVSERVAATILKGGRNNAQTH